MDDAQVVQDQLVAQKAETKKLTEQVAILTEKLQTLHCGDPCAARARGWACAILVVKGTSLIIGRD
jgi:cell division protein FtsB